MTEHPEIKLENIRAGDTIRVSYKGYDTEVTITGIAHKRDYRDDWTTESNMRLTNSLRTPAELYYLVNRPKPELPTAIDAIIRVTLVKDDDTFVGSSVINKLAVCDRDGDWAIQMPDGVEYFQPEHILAWNNVTIIDTED